ncbi:MAG: tetratricopeptide repeat protein [Bradymonadia bacterium]
MTHIGQDVEVVRLRAAYVALGDVVPTALSLGMLKMRRAATVSGEEKQRLLVAAEKLFLAIQAEGQGTAAYHLGLGQVYHQMGKVEEGERELKVLLDRKDPETTLAVARVYRSLGMEERAQAEAGPIAESSTEPYKSSAAVMMSLMAADEDEQRKWLSKADKTNDYVRISLVDLDGREALKQGHWKLADTKLAESQAYYAANSEVSSVAANNAAMSALARYQSTGEASRLAEALDYMNKARAQSPSDAMIVGNLSGIEATRIIHDVLAPQADLAVLKLADDEMSTVLEALLKGDAHEKLVDQMRRHSTLRGMFEHLREAQILAPARVSLTTDELSWASHTEDAPRMAAIKARLEQQPLPGAQERAQAWVLWLSGGEDQTYKKVLTEKLQRLERASKRVRKAHDKAIVAFLQSDVLSVLALVSGPDAPKVQSQAIAAVRQAVSHWPEAGFEYPLAWRLVEQAITEVAAQNPDVAKAWSEEQRRLRTAAFALKHLDDAEIMGPIRARPELKEAIKVLGERMLKSSAPTVTDWVLARLLEQPQWVAHAEQALSSPVLVDAIFIGALVSPHDPRAQLFSELVLQERQ